MRCRFFSLAVRLSPAGNFLIWSQNANSIIKVTLIRSRNGVCGILMAWLDAGSPPLERIRRCDAECGANASSSTRWHHVPQASNSILENLKAIGLKALILTLNEKRVWSKDHTGFILFCSLVFLYLVITSDLVDHLRQHHLEPVPMLRSQLLVDLRVLDPRLR